MPFYLVTHLSLVEGEDDVRAAQTVLAKLHSDDAVQFSVKADEVNIRQVTITNTNTLERTSNQPTFRLPLLKVQVPGAIGSRQAGVDHVAHPPLKQWRHLAKGAVLGLSLFAAGLFTGLSL